MAGPRGTRRRGARGQPRRQNQRSRSATRQVRGRSRSRSRSRDRGPRRSGTPAPRINNSGPSGVSGLANGGVVERVVFRKRVEFTGELGIQKAIVTCLDPTFPYAVSTIKNRTGWGVKKVNVQFDYMGEKNLNGRVRYLVISGNALNDAYTKRTEAEAWAETGKDPEHQWVDVPKAFSKWTKEDPAFDAAYGRVYEQWSNSNYLSVILLINITSTADKVSDNKFITATVSFEAVGPPNRL